VTNGSSSNALQEYQLDLFLEQFLSELRSDLVICCPANLFGLRKYDLFT